MPSDCELITSGVLAQPVNAVSSAAFLVAAVFVWRRHLLGGVALAAAGVGSVLGHGDLSPVPSLAHDVGLAALVAVVVVALWRSRSTLPWPWMLALAVGAFVWTVSRTDGPWCVEAAWIQGHAVWHVLAAIGAAGIITASVSAPATRPVLRSRPSDGPLDEGPRRSR